MLSHRPIFPLPFLTLEVNVYEPFHSSRIFGYRLVLVCICGTGESRVRPVKREAPGSVGEARCSAVLVIRDIGNSDTDRVFLPKVFCDCCVYEPVSHALTFRA